MALVLADRVKETTTTTGTGTITLAGASTGYQSFAAVGNGNTTFYCIAGQTTSEWEVGIGTYTSAGTTLARTTVLSNSAGTQPSALSFSAGTKDVFVTYPSEKSVNQDANGNASANNFFGGYTAVTAAAGTTVLTAASTQWQKITGSTTQTFTLPDATTLPLGATFIFDNDASGNVTINDNSSALVDTLVPGSVDLLFVESNSTAAGSWGKYSFLPASVNWGASTADLGGTTISNAIWNGSAIGTAYGGTGGTATPTAGGVGYGDGSALAYMAAGTAGQLLKSNGASAPSWFNGFSLISTQSTTSGILTFTGLSAYNNYMILVYPYQVAATTGVLNLTVATGSPATFISSGYVGSSGGVTFNTTAYPALKNATGGTASVVGVIFVYNCTTTTVDFAAFGGPASAASGSTTITSAGNVPTGGTSPITAIRLSGLASTGVGSAVLYGMS